MYKVLVSALFFTGLVVQAQIGQVTVAPKRLIFEDGTRRAEVALINESDQQTRFRIQVVEKTMNELTQLVDMETIPADSAAKMIRYSPRSVVLEPRGKQVIRLFVRIPNGLADGEYRSHLQFVAEPDLDAMPEPKSKDNESGFSSRLIPLYALSIPVIVRVGETGGTVTLENAKWAPLQGNPTTPAVVMLDAARQGNQSVYGDVRIQFKNGQSGEETVLFQRKGIALYTSLDRYKLAFPLNPPPGFEGGAGQLHVHYADRDGKVWIDQSIPMTASFTETETKTVDVKTY